MRFVNDPYGLFTLTAKEFMSENGQHITSDVGKRSAAQVIVRFATEPR
jgi:hypothetical protein